MASLDDAFITQISSAASARNPNAYLAHQQAASRQQVPGWLQQFDNTSFEWAQTQQTWQQPAEWLTPKQSVVVSTPVAQAINDSVSPQQAAAQIAHQHRFQPNELRLASDDAADTHWWFIRPRTATEYCYPKRFNYRAGDE